MACFGFFRRRRREEAIVWGNIIYFFQLSEKNQEQFIKDLPNLNKESLVLIVHGKCDKSKTDYLTRLLEALSKNQNITSLALGSAFLIVHEMHEVHNAHSGELLDGGIVNTYNPDLGLLNKMSKLQELTLHLPPEGHKIDFNALSIYLTNRECTLKKLTLPGGLTTAEIKELREIITNATNSLVEYYGPDEVEIRKILKDKHATEAVIDDLHAAEAECKI